MSATIIVLCFHILVVVAVLLRVILRHTDKTLTSEEANVLRDEIYGSIHEGSVYDWCVKRREE